jgi:3-deoxy-manno-octulosonate cytidylyltransferase (CMP-KDO synthetase)
MLGSKRIVGVIPARMGSSRFPGKPLAKILGRTMLEHVYRRTSMTPELDEVVVATCDEVIRRAVQSFGAKAVMTSEYHERASDRVCEASENVPADIYVMVQGDEPMVVPDMISSSLTPFQTNRSVGCVNLIRRITSPDEIDDPNTIKVVRDLDGRAMFFSRSRIPTGKAVDTTWFKQVCVIPFSADFLRLYSALEPTPLEKAESVDMMRFLEHGHVVHLKETEIDTFAVDTPDQLIEVERLLSRDPVTQSYVESGQEPSP